ncbi:MAG TPA: hypothetical protein VII72_07120 [Myxococcota bacterium]|jgi:hypothetical protein
MGRIDWRWQASLSCVLAVAWLAACGPVPGGSLGGQPAEVPANWSSAVEGDRTFCEVEARPEDPHSIQVECFLYEGALYVNSHRWVQASWWPVQSWAVVWMEHPDVKVRIGESIYPLVATPVTASPEREQVLAFRGYDPVPAGIVLFRFDPRPMSGD